MSNETVPALLPGLAIVAGTGILPQRIAEDCKRIGRPYKVVIFGDTELDWTAGEPVIRAPYEKPGRIFKALKAEGIHQMTLAGAVTRPKLSPWKFDFTMVKLATRILPAMKKGDDETLRTVTQVLEGQGFTIIAPHELLEELLAPEGVHSKLGPSEADRDDVHRAIKIVDALGAVDVGQGAVVAQGLCLATESIQGTDAMLDFVAKSGDEFRIDPEGSKGVLYKAPKPGQDWRVDLPAIGPDTFRKAAAAGLAGVVVEARGVLVLGLDDCREVADATGMFFWCRAVAEPEESNAADGSAA